MAENNFNKDRLYVGIQFLLFLVFIFSPFSLKLYLGEFWKTTTLIFISVGFILASIAVIQLNRNLSPFPTPVKNSKLLSTGVYTYIRHPIYGGILLMAYGYSIYSTDPLRLLISVSLFLLFYFKSRYEEKLLKEHFLDYQEYMKQTGRFFPTIYFSFMKIKK